MAGGMGVNKNKYVEDWGSYRENLEHHFRFTRRNFALIFSFGVLFPIVVYKGLVAEAHKHDSDYQRPPTKFM
ncbi:hypothetical protein KP509_20G019200 [Ceratopteris richardii]|uniref:Complex I-B15 n=1 Tax=Ceratopteris richardii TaxID=49495 RepID=A0A8T2SHD0_CERRI|nr:hypothetical protein KP509_20G019200 [Ceratopteris richardii]